MTTVNRSGSSTCPVPLDQLALKMLIRRCRRHFGSPFDINNFFLTNNNNNNNNNNDDEEEEEEEEEELYYEKEIYGDENVFVLSC